MKEIRQIVDAFDEAQRQGKQTALATVVQVEGSAYRRPGARMLVTEDGCLTGAISGGCLEGDALRKAQLAMLQQRSKLVTYDTSEDDDAKLGVGSGCNGIIHILIEPVNAGDPVNPVELLRKMLEYRQKAVIVTLYSTEERNGHQPGTSLLLLEDGSLAGNICEGISAAQLVAEAELAMINSESAFVTHGSYSAYVGFMKPAVSLVVIGAGNDVMPLVQIANTLGWDTTIVDGRPGYATFARFPTVKNIVITKPQYIRSTIAIDAFTVCTLMTHNYNYDLATLRDLLNCPISYIGVLGPKKKLQRMLQELAEEGIVLSNEQLDNIYGPTGLDIGAETPEEIAMSIAAEIKTVLSARNARPLKNKVHTIHFL